MRADSQSLKVYTEIRGKILTQALMPKTRLKEAEWAKKLDVSRMAVREALNRLLGERLVSLGEKGGFYIAVSSEDDIRQLRKLREILEIGALRLAYEKINHTKLGRLQKICDEFSAMVGQGYYSGALEADVKFHETLVDLSGNEKLKEIYQHANISMFQLTLGKFPRQLQDFESTDIEHRRIVQHLKAKKLKLAENALIDHFARGEAAVLGKI